MMQQVPRSLTPNSVVSSEEDSSSNFGDSNSSSNFDFDLGLLTGDSAANAFDFESDKSLGLFDSLASPAHSSCSLNSFASGNSFGDQQLLQQQQQVPSPTSVLHDIHASPPTMFSPMSDQQQKKHSYAPGLVNSPAAASSTSSAAGCPPSPYSPVCRAQTGGQRLSSTDSYASGGGNFSLQESLAEFNELQNKIKLENDLGSPPPPPPYNMAATSATSAAGPCSPVENMEATVQIKIEPVDANSALPELRRYGAFDLNVSTGCFNKPDNPPPAYPSTSSSTSAAAIKTEDATEDEGDVLSLAMEQVRSDIKAACQTLNISHSEYNMLLKVRSIESPPKTAIGAFLSSSRV